MIENKETITQVLCSLMQYPKYLSETDKYSLSLEDFSIPFFKYIFSAIYNLYENGAQSITVVDINNYFEVHPAAKACFEKNNGIEYLQDGLDYSQKDNFPFYYRRLKKFNALIDLQKLGQDTSFLYEEDLTSPNAKEINDAFEELEVRDIFKKVKERFDHVESKYGTGDASATEAVNEGLRELVESLKLSPDVGAPLQGNIFNTICRGARKSKFYLRSASSGLGKTRMAVGDACYLSYPVRYDQLQHKWVWRGSSEKTLIIVTEQEKDEIQTLILAYLSGINEEEILYGTYSEDSAKIIEQAINVMDYFKDNLYVVRLSNPNIEQIKAVIRSNYMDKGIKNVFYDYIFSSPSLLNEFRDLRIREDVALMMLSTALKDLGVEMDLFMMSSTQVNAKQEETGGIKSEKAIRGARSIADKCDVACIASRITPDEYEALRNLIEESGLYPNMVTDLYKARRSKVHQVRIWSDIDLGTCRKEDLFVTDARFKPIQDFNIVDFVFNEREDEVITLLGMLNNDEKEPEF